MNNSSKKNDFIPRLKEHPENSMDKILQNYQWDSTLKSNDSSFGNCPTGHSSESEKCFHVSFNKQLCHCFSCGFGGDVINLVQEFEKCSTKTAISILAKRAGLEDELNTKENFSKVDKLDQSNHVYNVLTDAAKFYFKQAQSEPWFLDLMLRRYGLTNNTLEKNLIGYSTGTGLYDFLIEKGHDMTNVLSCGLFYPPSSRGGPVEVFRNRLFIPYFQNSLVKYAIGRKTHLSKDDSSGKYIKLSTGEGSRPDISHPCIDGAIIWGEDSIKNNKEIFCLEGVTDGLMAQQLGVPAISPATTRFSKKQLDRLEVLLKGKTLYVVGDTEPNKQGERGSLDTARALNEQGIKAKVTKIPLRGL